MSVFVFPRKWKIVSIARFGKWCFNWNTLNWTNWYKSVITSFFRSCLCGHIFMDVEADVARDSLIRGLHPVNEFYSYTESHIALLIPSTDVVREVNKLSSIIVLWPCIYSARVLWGKLFSFDEDFFCREIIVMTISYMDEFDYGVLPASSATEFEIEWGQRERDMCRVNDYILNPQETIRPGCCSMKLDCNLSLKKRVMKNLIFKLQFLNENRQYSCNSRL